MALIRIQPKKNNEQNTGKNLITAEENQYLSCPDEFTYVDSVQCVCLHMLSLAASSPDGDDAIGAVTLENRQVLAIFFSPDCNV